jgi:hypothetical protein
MGGFTMNPYTIFTSACRVVTGLARGLYVLGLTMVGAFFLLFGVSVILNDTLYYPQPFTLMSIRDMMQLTGHGSIGAWLFYLMPVMLGCAILVYAGARALRYLDPDGRGLALVRRAVRKDRIRDRSER